MKPRFDILQNPSRRGFILRGCTYKQYFSSMLSLDSKKNQTDANIIAPGIYNEDVYFFASGKIMQGIDI